MNFVTVTPVNGFRSMNCLLARVRLSAKTGLGLEYLRQALVETAASKHPLEDQDQARDTGT